ncbi:UPF0182 family protein [Schaalia sp. 19OD2882]|uniref:UPF0182 family membrane protein n=1 Tax=Schaalia sp. 19OD2882 TaxID=2794089 RepID=UPI0020A7A47E|nr:UPF0182 family protein [Schaalia sp. 19OD2882]
MSAPTSSTRGRSNGAGGRRIGPGTVVVLVLAALGFFIHWASSFWTEILWFDQMGSLRVLLTRWGAVAGMFVIGFLLVALPMRWTLVSAWKNRKAATRGESSASLRGYQEAIEPVRGFLFWAVPVFFGLTNGTALAANWQTVLTFVNQTPFGRTDPQFGFDVSFYVFTMPMLGLLVGYLLRLLAMLLVASLVVNYLYGTIRLTPRPHASRPARLQAGMLAAMLAASVGVHYWVGRYALLTQDGERWDGAMFTDITATLPAHSILAVVSGLVAVLFVVAAFKGTWRLPAAGMALTAVSALVIGAAYPALVQQFRVVPNERQLESDYIQRNIDATLAAYGLEGLDYRTYDAKTSVEPGQLRSDTQTTAQIRLLDPLVIEKTVQQLQQSKPYYAFANGFSVDRYTVSDERRDTVIAMRELNLGGLDENQRTWANLHTVFTHGFGVVAAYGNQVTGGGLPAYWEQSIPSKGEMGEYEPRIYFSPSATDYSIVGAPEGAPDQELDYPDDTAPGGQVSTTFKGNGGPSVGNAWNKLLYSVKFGSTDIFFSSQTNEASQILYDRDPLLRVSKVAPYLTLEQEAYPAVVDMDGDPATPKRLVWVVDAYTTSDDYPYSEHRALDQSTVDSRNSQAGEFVQANSVNYMRNSVKAVVDAYDGSVRLFQWDQQDPVLATWMKIYPDSVEPISAISGDLMGHLRYPEDLFKVQRELLTSYHVTSAPDFYTGGDKWRLAQETSTATAATVTQKDPLGNETQVPVAQPPYYLTMKMPGQDSAEFSLTSVFVPGGTSNRQAMAGFLAVDSETGSEPGKAREGYGKLRLIALPSSTTVPGPGQIQNAYDTGEKIAPQLNILNLSDSKVIRGNLLTLPVGGGLLYVQPVYIQGSGNAQYPILRFVLTAFGDQVGFAPTLAESLDQTFGGDSAATLARGGGTPSAPSDEGGAAAPKTAQQRLDEAIVAASNAMKESEKARVAGDWSAYGKAQKDLDQALSAAVQAQQELGRDTSGIQGQGSDDAQSSAAGAPGGAGAGTGGAGGSASQSGN